MNAYLRTVFATQSLQPVLAGHHSAGGRIPCQLSSSARHPAACLDGCLSLPAIFRPVSPNTVHVPGRSIGKDCGLTNPIPAEMFNRLNRKS